MSKNEKRIHHRSEVLLGGSHALDHLRALERANKDESAWLPVRKELPQKTYFDDGAAQVPETKNTEDNIR